MCQSLLSQGALFTNYSWKLGRTNSRRNYNVAPRSMTILSIPHTAYLCCIIASCHLQKSGWEAGREVETNSDSYTYHRSSDHVQWSHMIKILEMLLKHPLTEKVAIVQTSQSAKLAKTRNRLAFLRNSHPLTNAQCSQRGTIGREVKSSDSKTMLILCWVTWDKSFKLSVLQCHHLKSEIVTVPAPLRLWWQLNERLDIK